MSVLVYCLAVVYGTSIPRGGTMGLSFVVVALCFPVVGMYIAIVLFSMLRKEMNVAVWLSPIFAGVTAIMITSGIVAGAHWQWIKHDLTEATATSDCPPCAGLAAVHDCTKFAGRPAYDLGGGLLDLVYLTQASELPPRHEVQRELDDGWRVVLVRF